MDRKKLIAGNVKFIPSGSTLLDLALGGGWASGRIFNLVGDRSSGKTLLAIEAFANFSKVYPEGRMRYGEAESAFDDAFAETLGFPTTVEKPEKPLETVEEFYDDLNKFSDPKLSQPSFYILDSLDALSDKVEKESEIDAKTFGASKAKQMSQLFRRIVQQLGASQCTLGVISQVRDNIGSSWGDGNTRSGGRALDFYSSQIVWLNETGKLKRTVTGQERAIGVEVKAKCKKNKVGLPFREAEFPIIFNYGIDNVVSILNWLKSLKAITEEELKSRKKELDKIREAVDYPKLVEVEEVLIKRARIEWRMLEDAISPRVKKYFQEVPIAVGKEV